MTSTFGSAAVKRYYARHEQAQDIQWFSAAVIWNPASLVYEIEVCGHIVAECLTIRAVEIFCDYHNSRLMLGLNSRDDLTAIARITKCKRKHSQHPPTKEPLWP